jgi:hypothetical protein
MDGERRGDVPHTEGEETPPAWVSTQLTLSLVSSRDALACRCRRQIQ